MSSGRVAGQPIAAGTAAYLTVAAGQPLAQDVLIEVTGYVGVVDFRVRTRNTAGNTQIVTGR